MSDNSLFHATSDGDTAPRDLIACEKAMRVLQQHYPDHPWLIGADQFAGMIHCRLLYNGQGVSNNGYGFMLRLSTIESADGERRLMQAGGECLERFNLAREHATAESALRAAEHGLDLTNIVTKSKH